MKCQYESKAHYKKKFGSQYIDMSVECTGFTKVIMARSYREQNEPILSIK